MGKKKIYTVATAHLDTVWSWDFEKTVSKYIPRTLTDNFRLFEKYPNYTFSFEGAYRYELMEEYYPQLFEKMKEYIKKGRWHVCGSAYENGDVNIPSPEALFRNILIGNSYFEKKFGIRSCDIYLPDCFGFGWALPSIMNHANLKGFTTQKLAWGSAYGIPFDIGRWKGVDGKEVYASVNPHDYYFTLKELRDWDFVKNKMKENEKFDLDWTYIFHGIGDRGGAPKEESVAFVEKEIAKNNESDVEVVAAYADEIYNDIDEKFTDGQKAKLPVWNNELVMQNHAVGGYTSRSVGKRWNRMCEETADIAERGSVMSNYLLGTKYNKEVLDKAWKRTIAHHFHDDMPGTSCQRVYKRSWNDLAVSVNQFANELDAAVSPVSQLLDTSFCKGTPVMVYNSIEAQRYGSVKVVLENVKTPYAVVYDEKGNEVKSQSRKLENRKTEVVFAADVKSLGLRAYDIRESLEMCKTKSDIAISGRTMENQKYIVALNNNGDIASIIDKEQGGIELLKEPVSLGLFNYTGSKDWPAWEMNYKEANKEADRIPQAVKIEIYENGPARVAFKVKQKDNRSTFENIIALSDGGKIVEVYSEIEWQSLQTMAKHKFAFTCENDTAVFDLGLGAIERENMSEKLFEVPAQKWADITDRSSKYGVSVISECKYGWDKFADNTLRLTVLHTPKGNYRIDSMQSFMDLGLNRYSFAIFSHEGTVGADTQMQARMFTQPMTAFVCENHKGKFKNGYSFGSISTNNVIIRAIKQAQDSDEIVVRLGEGIKKNVKNFTLTLGKGIESAIELYASEEYKGEATVKDGKLVTDFAPYETKTFALKLKPSTAKAQKAASQPIKLSFDKNIITNQGKKGDFEYTIPYELIPESFTACGADFEINKNGNNAVAAKSQTIDLGGNSNKLVLLCASLAGDKKVSFKVGNKTVSKTVNSALDRFARWDLYDLGETAKIKQGKVALELTHCHKNGKDEIAKIMYFYAIELDITDAETVTLPDDNDIVIIAASEVSAPNAYLATPLFDEVKERPLTFKKTAREKLEYINAKLIWNLRDKDDFLTGNNRGKSC